ETYNLDPEKLDALFKRHPELCEKTKVIIPVHLYGQCAEMKSIAEIAGRYGIQIIEDAAQAIGADYPWKETKEGSTGEIVWKRSGSMGILGCFSFFPSKNLGGIGDGGMVVTNDEGMAEKMKILRVHGSKPKYYHRLIGGNFRLDPVQAAVLSVKLPYLEGWHQRRRENATTYDSLFSEAGLTGEGVVRLPQAAYGKYVAQGKPVNSHIYNQYTIRVKDRGRLREFLKGAGIDTEIYYPVPLHLQECYAGLGYTAGDFPEAERAASEVLALPIYPELTREMQAYVVEKVREFYD
ncbi:MAG: DegT/DnrJ/EryC1/StrS family aminotransferase, partial [Nitrospirota bacterium]|nr:DegT/DnrJ/EryC1/StrS family aminotransferase [Nitrospirota bacterium]